MHVKDNTAEANFTFIGKQGEQLVGASAQQLLTEQPPTDNRVLPQKLEQLKTNKFLFTVHWGRTKFISDSITYPVIRTKPIPTTTETLPRTATPAELPPTPPKQHQKLRFVTKLQWSIINHISQSNS